MQSGDSVSPLYTALFPPSSSRPGGGDGGQLAAPGAGAGPPLGHGRTEQPAAGQRGDLQQTRPGTGYTSRPTAPAAAAAAGRQPGRHVQQAVFRIAAFILVLGLHADLQLDDDQPHQLVDGVDGARGLLEAALHLVQLAVLQVLLGDGRVLQVVCPETGEGSARRGDTQRRQRNTCGRKERGQST